MYETIHLVRHLLKFASKIQFLSANQGNDKALQLTAVRKKTENKIIYFSICRIHIKAGSSK